MNILNRSLITVAMSFALAVTSQTHSAELKLSREGWTSWQVAAVDDAPAWCCWSSGQDRDAARLACRLDGSPEGYGSRSGDATTDSVKVYARVAAGKIERLQVLSATCPVETRTPIHELGSVATDDSTRWLVEQARQHDTDGFTRQTIGESALAALAMHRGDLSRDALAGFARSDARTETRKWAIFWLAVLRGSDGADITSSVMFNDQDADVRQHAAFAMTQSKLTRVAPDLIRLGNTDKVGDVRAQAWFWLAHMGAAEAEQAIAAALRKESDDHVREQAIFALSQLPDDRATRALIGAAEDQTLSREQRKRAVFWLAQSESLSAQAYLEKVLARSSN